MSETQSSSGRAAIPKGVRAAYRWGAIICPMVNLLSTEGAAQALSPDDALGRLTAKDITESLISAVNLTTTAGIRGMHLIVDGQDGQPDLKYDKFNLRIPKSWRTANPKLGIYTEIGVGDLIVDDRFVGTNVDGDRVSFRADRNVLSARVGLGVDYQPTPELSIAPHVMGIWSRIKSETDVTGGSIEPVNLTPSESALLSDWKTKSWTVAAVVRAEYRHWFGENQRLDLLGDYAIAYSETYDESLPILATSGSSNSLQLEAGWTSITSWKAFGKPIYWNAFLNSVSFPGQEKDDLGFTYLFGIGAGLGLYLNKSIFGDFAHVNFAGVEVTAIVGNDVTGGAIGFSLRF